MSRPVTRVTPVEKRREEENKEKKPPSVVKKNTHLDPDWIPSEYQLTYAKDKGMGEEQIRRAAENFRDWAVSNAVLKADWDATWRRWVRTDLERTPTNGAVRTNGKVDMYAVARRLREQEARQ
jgi:phage terminase large subunit